MSSPRTAKNCASSVAAMCSCKVNDQVNCALVDSSALTSQPKRPARMMAFRETSAVTLCMTTSPRSSQLASPSGRKRAAPLTRCRVAKACPGRGLSMAIDVRVKFQFPRHRLIFAQLQFVNTVVRQVDDAVLRLLRRDAVPLSIDQVVDQFADFLRRECARLLPVEHDVFFHPNPFRVTALLGQLSFL